MAVEDGTPRRTVEPTVGGEFAQMIGRLRERITRLERSRSQPLYGPTADRPLAPAIGDRYLDTDLGIPIWALSIAPPVWIDATGATV